MTKNFGELKYWEERYETEEREFFDWLGDFQRFQEIIEKNLNGHQAKILIPGCGNSKIGFDLFDHGYKTILNLDYSKTIIDAMNQIASIQYPKSINHVKWEVGDCANMINIQDESFDLIIDKSTLDAFSCGDEGLIIKYLKECKRVLKDDGVLLIISYSDMRLIDLQKDWIVNVIPAKNLQKSNIEAITFTIVYECKKKSNHNC